MKDERKSNPKRQILKRKNCNGNFKPDPGQMALLECTKG